MLRAACLLASSWLCLGLAAMAAAEDVPPRHPAVGQKWAPTDVDRDRPLYLSTFDDAAALVDWRLEGGEQMSIADGKLVLASRNEGVPAENKNHLVCWLTKELPADFVVEFSVRPRDRRDGLNIVFFNARGLGGEGIFDPSFAPRTGDFKQYHSGDLKNYHLSYWASSLENGPREDANLRKNPGKQLVAVGQDLVAGAPADAFQTVRLYKRGGTIRLTVDDVVSVAYDDDGTTHGPVWDHAGWLGLRQMGRTVRCEYDHVAVYALAPTATESEVAAPDDPAARAVPWPTPAMQDLPADYLARLRASLVPATVRLPQLDPNDPRDSIGFVRYGLPAMLMGRKIDEINRFYESDKFEFLANPKFGFSLFSVSYMRLYGLLNDRTGTIPGVLTKQAQTNFERGMWGVAKANAKISEARRDVWDTEGSENHHLANKTCDLLCAQWLRNIPEYANQKYDDGSTLAEQYETRRAYFLKYFDERAKRGQFVEAASPSYMADSVSAIFNLRDFAEDPVLRRKAEMYLDLTYAVMAEETLLTTRGGPKSRVKVGHEYDGGMSDRSYNVIFDAPGRTYEPIGDTIRATSDYYPPPAVVSLAKDVNRRGTYTFATRWPGPIVPGKSKRSGDPDGQLWASLDPTATVLRHGFCTPSYVLGSANVDPARTDDQSGGFRWQGVVFASDPLARIGFEVRPANRKEWHGFNPFYGVQDRNVLITQRWAPVPPNAPAAHPAVLQMYFSPTLDEVVEADGWIFVRDGAAFAAAKVVAGGYSWTPAWKHSQELTSDNKAFVTLHDPEAAVILVCNEARDYANDFAAFQKAIAAQPVKVAAGRVEFATLKFAGLAEPPQIDGKPVDLNPRRGYDSPFLRSDWGSGLFYLRKGDETVTLDFRDSENPTKVLGGPITADYPPGTGTTAPIVFK